MILRNSRTGGARPGGVTVIQPYVPAYRVPFFDEVDRILQDAGSHLSVVHGSPQGGQAQRGDARQGMWSVPVRSRHLSVGGHLLSWRPVLGRARASTVVVAELASTNLDTYLLMADASLRSRLVLWGHGRAYVNRASRLDARAELRLAKLASHVLVYTQGGADYLLGHDLDPSRVTVVRNSTDTAALRRLKSALGEHDVADFRSRHHLGPGPVASFVGSYDDSKCLPLLFQAADRVASQRSQFRLLLAGTGPLQGFVEEAASSRPFVTVLPRAEPRDLATIGSASSCLVVPGRVGLVAVDALALGLPVVTTTYPHHAPEWEYLTDDVKVVARQNAEDLGRELMGLLDDPVRTEAAQRASAQLGESLSIESMAAAFCRPLLAQLTSSR